MLYTARYIYINKMAQPKKLACARGRDVHLIARRREIARCCPMLQMYARSDRWDDNSFSNSLGTLLTNESEKNLWAATRESVAWGWWINIYACALETPPIWLAIAVLWSRGWTRFVFVAQGGHSKILDLKYIRIRLWFSVCICATGIRCQHTQTRSHILFGVRDDHRAITPRTQTHTRVYGVVMSSWLSRRASFVFATACRLKYGDAKVTGERREGDERGDRCERRAHLHGWDFWKTLWRSRFITKTRLRDVHTVIAVRSLLVLRCCCAAADRFRRGDLCLFHWFTAVFHRYTCLYIVYTFCIRCNMCRGHSFWYRWARNPLFIVSPNAHIFTS